VLRASIPEWRWLQAFRRPSHPTRLDSLVPAASCRRFARRRHFAAFSFAAGLAPLLRKSVVPARSLELEAAADSSFRFGLLA
jgi:hypothetical protein